MKFLIAAVFCSIAIVIEGSYYPHAYSYHNSVAHHDNGYHGHGPVVAYHDGGYGHGYGYGHQPSLHVSYDHNDHHHASYVAKTPGAVHHAKLPGHVHSVHSINAAPAPGTHQHHY